MRECHLEKPIEKRFWLSFVQFCERKLLKTFRRGFDRLVVSNFVRECHLKCLVAFELSPHTKGLCTIECVSLCFLVLSVSVCVWLCSCVFFFVNLCVSVFRAIYLVRSFHVAQLWVIIFVSIDEIIRSFRRSSFLSVSFRFDIAIDKSIVAFVPRVCKS